MKQAGYDFHSVTATKRGQLQVKLVAANVGPKGPDPDADRFHRYVLDPGADLADEYPEVIAAAGKVWTPAVLAAWGLHQASLESAAIEVKG